MFHFLVDTYPAVAWLLDAPAPDVPVLVRDDAPQFVHDSFALGGAGRLSIVPVGDTIRVQELLIGDGGVRTLGWHDATAAAMARLRACAASRPRQGGVYISRRDSRKRPLTNEAALEAALEARGIETVVMSDMPFAEQVARVDRAAVVVAPHGAGLGLLAAAAPGLRVFEAVPAMRGSLDLRVCMARISMMVGHEHHLWLEATRLGLEWAISLDPFLEAFDAFSRAPAPSWLVGPGDRGGLERY
jgi:capsular polysaccharide biosynthesis protein